MTSGKIKSVSENVRRYTGRNGELFVHMITLAEPIDGVSDWEYHSKSPQCTKFTADAETTFTTEVKQKGQYTDYKITPMMPPPMATAAPGIPKFVGGGKDEGRITALSAVASACAFYAHRAAATPVDVMAFAEKIFDYASGKSTK